MGLDATFQKVLLTGATGFVGRHLHPALVAAGYDVRCGTRDVVRARETVPDSQWVTLDVDNPATLRGALEGCDAAYYLVHGMNDGANYAEREARAAEVFREAAENVGLRRIVYLGGVSPHGRPSPHLRSRLNTGRILRSGTVPVFELRAAMILGVGSVSWQMVRDLVTRLPAMILPRWLRNRSRPIAIEDVVRALLAALVLPDAHAGWFDVPGPETLSHRELLERVAKLLGKHPHLFDVPVLTPRLSSYWIALITRVDLRIARELVRGLESDLVPDGEGIWALLPDHVRLPLDNAIENALVDERFSTSPTPLALERLGAVARESLSRGSDALESTL